MVFKKIPQVSCPYRMKSVGLFIFGDCDIYKLGQACIYTGYEKRVAKGEYSLWLWVSNRGEQHPCQHTIFRRRV